MRGELQRRVGANLRALRKAKGLSQERYAEELGVHRTYIGGIERGERNFELQTLESFAERLGVDPLELLEPVPDRPESPKLAQRARGRPRS